MTISTDRSSTLAALAACFAVSLLTACTYAGGIDRPGVQKVSWFSYLNGDDIRSACQPGSVPRWRLIYNGQYEQQIRSYELVGDGHGGATYTARVQTPASLTRITLDNPLEPWAWKTSEVLLSPPEVQDFETTLQQSGAYGPTPRGLRLHSRNFYWILIACRDGAVHYNAWLHPSEEWDRLVFDDWLLRFDETQVAFREPRFVDPAERLNDRITRGSDDSSVNFDVQVGERGLVGHLSF